MEMLMIALFLIGAGYAVLSLVFGDLLGFDFHPGGLPVLSPTVIAAFLTVFGGTGWLLLSQTSWTPLAAAAVSLLVALAVSTVVLFFVVIPLEAAQKGVAPSAKQMIGMEAEVITPIEPGRLGEIVYLQSGTRHSAPARTADGSAVGQGTVVTIVGENAGTFIVAQSPAGRNE